MTAEVQALLGDELRRIDVPSQIWDDGRLIIHTNQMRSGQYQRIQPNYSEQVETVEVWENREARSGRRIELNVVVLPGLRRDSVDDPVFFLAGGPGRLV